MSKMVALQQRTEGTADADAFANPPTPGTLLRLDACGFERAVIHAVTANLLPGSTGGVGIHVGVMHPEGMHHPDSWGAEFTSIGADSVFLGATYVLPHPLPVPVVQGRLAALFFILRKGGNPNDAVVTWHLEVP